MEKEYNDLIGDILEASGEKDNFNLKGMGKPLPKDYVQRDVYQNFQKIAREAGYLPYWLKLQKEISELVSEAENEKHVRKINKKIKEYNMACPAPMQRQQISLDNLEKAKEAWS